MTIEELARRADIAFTTIRLYQHRGLLHPPARRGRVGIYDQTHLARLRLITELRSRGYSLAAIKELADDWQQGRTLTQVLGLEAEAVAAITPGVELRLLPNELARHFEGVDLTPASMNRAFELGLVAFDNDQIIVHDPAFLEVGSSLARMGVPLEEILDEYEHLRATTNELAERFTRLFQRNLWQPFADAGMPAEQITTLTESLATLGPLAETIVQTTLHRALADQAAQFLDEHATALAHKNQPAPPKRAPRTSSNRG